jgi:hypothetical protein
VSWTSIEWALWLGAPLAITFAAALATWIRNRPRPPLTSEQTIVEHRDFLAALADATPPPAASPVARNR